MAYKFTLLNASYDTVCFTSLMEKCESNVMSTVMNYFLLELVLNILRYFLVTTTTLIRAETAPMCTDNIHSKQLICMNA